MIIEKTGNIFTTKCQTIVNTINCVGIMGAGIAYEFRLRDKEMFESYKLLCADKKIDIGKLWIYNTKHNSYSKILNFPTKYDWKYPSKIEYLNKGLEKFVNTYKIKGINSIAFPLLGADRGGIDKEVSLQIMKKYLSKCDIDIEIWHYDPMAKDDLYEKFKIIFNEINIETIKKESKIRLDILKKIQIALNKPRIRTISGLLTEKGIGDKSLEKLFFYTNNYKKNNTNLFNFYN